MKLLIVIIYCAFVSISAPAFAQKAIQNPSSEEDVIEKKKISRNILAESSKAANGSALTSLKATVTGTFWRNTKWVEMLGLSTDQQSQMDDIFQQYRLKLIDLTGALQKEELILEPLLGRTRPVPEVESKILSQIDRIADARAELEKANSRMLIHILQVLTPDQWSKLPIATKKDIKFFGKATK